jgi:hypothetical protein
LTVFPWISFNGLKLTLGGYHLPPMGNPDNVKVTVCDGVIYNFIYPLLSSGHQKTMWYWPNAGLSGFQLEIDLAASDPNTDPFTVSLIDTTGIETFLKFPTNFRSFVGLPRNINQIERVQNNQ